MINQNSLERGTVRGSYRRRDMIGQLGLAGKVEEPGAGRHHTDGDTPGGQQWVLHQSEHWRAKQAGRISGSSSSRERQRDSGAHKAAAAGTLMISLSLCSWHRPPCLHRKTKLNDQFEEQLENLLKKFPCLIGAIQTWF